MKKEILLSMLAAGAVPVVAYAQTAAEKLTGDVKDLAKGKDTTAKLWLVAGEYTVTATNGLKAQLSVDGKEFVDKVTLTQTTEVSVKVSNDTNTEKITGTFTVKYTLSDAQKSKVKNLQDRIIAAINETSEGAATDALKDLNIEASAFYGRTSKIVSDWSEYKAFVGGEHEAELARIEGSIKAAATNFECYDTVSKGLKELLASLEEAWSAVAGKSYAEAQCKAAYESTKKTITDNQAALEEAYAKGQAGMAYSLEKWNGKEAQDPQEAQKGLKKEIEEAIDGLKKAIADAYANDAAYTEVAAKIEEAKKAQSQAVQDIITLLDNEKDLMDGEDVYDDWLKEAQGEINELFNVIMAAEKANGTADSHNEAAKNKTANVDALAGLDFEAIVTTWTAKYNAQKAAYDKAIGKTIKGVQDALNATKADGEPQTVLDDIKAAQDDIDALTAMVKDGNRKHTITTDAAQKAIKDAVKAINDKIAAINVKAKPYTDNYKALQANLAAIKALQDALDETKAPVAALASKDKKYDAAGTYAKTVADLQAAISALKASAEKAYVADKPYADENATTKTDCEKWGAGEFEKYKEGDVEKTRTNDQKMAMVAAAIKQYCVVSEKTETVDGKEVKTKYVSGGDVKASLDKYEEVVAALPEYKTALEALTAKVTLDAVKTGSTTYGAEKARIAKAIKDIEDALAAAMAVKDDEHTKGMAAINLDASIKSDCSALVASYDKDKEKYDKDAKASAIAALQASAGNLIDKNQKSIDNLGWKDDKGNSLVGKATADIEKEVSALQAKLEGIKKENNASDKTLDYLTAINTKLAALEKDIAALKDGAVATAVAKVAANNAAKKEIDPLYQAVNEQLNGRTKTDKLAEIVALELINKDSSRDSEFGPKSQLVTGYDNELAAIKDEMDEAIADESLPNKIDSYKKDIYEDSKPINDAVMKWTEIATGGSWGGNDVVSVREAYAGWNNLDLTAYSNTKKVKLPRGKYKFTVQAFYRQGLAFNTAPTTSNAYLVAGDKQVTIKTLASEVDGTAANTMEEAAAEFAKGKYVNTLEFELAEEKEIELGVKGIFDLKQSWCIVGGATLDQSKYVKTEEFTGLKERINTLNNKVVASRADAQASTDNFNAKKAANTYIATYGEVRDSKGEVTKDGVSVSRRISNAVGDIAKDEFTKDGKTQTAWGAKGDNLAYWTNYLNGSTKKEGTLMATFDGINADIEKYYSAEGKRDMVAQLDGIKKRVDALVDAINKAVVDAKASEKAHNEQVALLKQVQKEWSDAYYKLSTEDESTHLTTDQNALAGYQTELNTISKAMDEAFAKGASKSDDKSEALNSISTNIAKLLDTWKEMYDEYIAKDNADRYADFQKAVTITSDAFTTAIETLDRFSKIKNEGLATAMASLQGTHEAIYEYATKIRDLKSAAKKSYDETASPALWDEALENKGTAETYTDEIESTLKTYTDGVNNVAATEYGKKKVLVESAVSTAEASIAGYAEDARKDAFKDIKDIIKAADALVAKDANGNYKNGNTLAFDIDQHLQKLEGYEDMVAADLEAAAQKEWSLFITVYTDTVEVSRANLETYGVDAEEYEEMVENSVTLGQELAAAAIAEDKLYAQLAACKKAVTDNWNDKAYTTGRDAFEANEANKAAAARVIEASATAQEAINALTAWAAVFDLTDGHASGIASVQGLLDGILAKNESYKKQGKAVANEEVLKNEIKALAETTVPNEYDPALDSEHKAVNEAIEVLKSDYNKAAAANMDDASLDNYKKTIADYEAQLATADLLSETYAFKEETDAAKVQEGRKAIYAELEGKVAATQKELTDKYNAAAAAEAIAAINTTLEAAKADKAAAEEAIAAIHEPVAKKYASSIKGINSSIATVAEAIAGVESELAEYGEEKILTYNSIVSKHAEDAKAAAAKAVNDIKPYTDIDIANETAKANVYASIKAVEDSLAAVVATIETYENVNVDDYKYNLDGLTKIIENWREYAEEEYANVNTNQNIDNEWQLTTIGTVLLIATKNDISAEYTKVQNALSDVRKAYILNKTASDYAEGAFEQLNNEYTELVRMRKRISIYNGNMFNDGYSNVDINGEQILDEEGNPTTDTRDYMEVEQDIRAALASLSVKISELEAFALQNNYVLGDADADGVVDINDYNTVIAHILTRQLIEEGTKEFLGADVNKDGAIRIGDATGIISIIKEEYATATAAMSRGLYRANNDAVSAAASDNGTTQRLAIMLDNSRSYVACQMDITLPEGITLMTEQAGERAEGHSLYSNDVTGGAHRVVLASTDNAVIEGSKGAILYLDLNVSSNYEGGDIVISDIEAVDTNMRSYMLNNVVVGGDATGIHTVTMMQDIKNRIYNMGGQMMNGMKKGLNIIVGEDGSAKKVVR